MNKTVLVTLFLLVVMVAGIMARPDVSADSSSEGRLKRSAKDSVDSVEKVARKKRDLLQGEQPGCGTGS